MTGGFGDKRVQWWDSPPRPNADPVQPSRVHEPMNEGRARDRSSPEGLRGNGTGSLRKTPEDPTGPVRSEPLDLSNKANFVFGKLETSTPRTLPKYSSSKPDSASIVREWQGANTPLAETYFSRLPSPEDPEYRQAVTLYSDKFEAISPPSDLEDLFVNFCSMKSDQWSGVYSLFGAEMMESGYLTGLDNDLVHVSEGIESPPEGLLRAIGENPDPENDVIRADCLGSPPDHLSTVTPDHENESEQLIAPIFLGAHGGHSSKVWIWQIAISFSRAVPARKRTCE
jgi:hypothetical protein